MHKISENKLVSVIIPTYKRHEKLNRALRSVVNQTYGNLEIIVVNDYPEENIEDYIEVEDPRIKIINLEENKGGSGARNGGIERAEGRYIGFLDDDDEYLLEKIEKQVKRIAELPEEYGLVATGIYLVFGDGSEKRLKENKSKSGKIYKKQLRDNQIETVTPLVKKECFKEVGLFDENLEARQDYEMWLRILKEYKAAFIEEPLVKQYIGAEDRVSKDPKKRYRASKKVFEKHKEEIKKDKKALEKHYMRMGIELAYFDTLEAIKYLSKSIRLKRSFIVFLTLLLPLKFRKRLLDKIRRIKKKI